MKWKNSDEVASQAWLDSKGTLKFVASYEVTYTLTVKATDDQDSTEVIIFVIVAEPAKDVSDSTIENSLDTPEAKITLSSTDESAASYTFDETTSYITINGLEQGFTNIQIVAEDPSEKVVILLMVDVVEPPNATIGYISNGTIYIGQDAYIVPLEEVYANMEDGEAVTYDVTITPSKSGIPSETPTEEPTVEDDSAGEEIATYNSRMMTASLTNMPMFFAANTASTKGSNETSKDNISLKSLLELVIQFYMMIMMYWFV